VCPICQSKVDPEKVTIKEEIFQWLGYLKENNLLDSWLFYSKTIHEQAIKGTTAQVVAESVRLFEDRILSMTREELTKFSTTLSEITIGLTERVSKPTVKGEFAELGTLDELEKACSEDAIKRLGGSGEPDIIAKPRHKGVEIGQTVIIEVKDTTRWSSQYQEQLEKFMQEYNTPFGILATRDLPAEAEVKGFSVSCGERGIMLITRLEYGALAYQILRKILVAFYLEGKEVVDYRALFKDEELLALLTEAKDYAKYVRSIRKHVRDIEKDLEEMQNQLDKRLDGVLYKISAFQVA
jgi:hypothetical protein